MTKNFNNVIAHRNLNIIGFDIHTNDKDGFVEVLMLTKSHIDSSSSSDLWTLITNFTFISEGTGLPTLATIREVQIEAESM